LEPLIVTAIPAGPDVGVRDSMTGLELPTVKSIELLEMPSLTTTTGPVVAPDGTAATILVEVQDIADAGAPLNVTVVEPCVFPKFTPETVTACPAGPVAGLSDKIAV
jgi:hypothetical protein